MDFYMLAVPALAGIFAGALALYWLGMRPLQASGAALSTQLAGERDLRITAETKLAACSQTASRVPDLEREGTDLKEKVARLETDLRHERSGAEAKIAELRRMGEEIERKFQVLAGNVLDQNSARFLELVSERFAVHKSESESALELRQQAIDALVKPISVNLDNFGNKVADLEKARIDAYAKLQQQVASLNASQSDLRVETGRLVQALHRPATRGRWGEIQLRQVLEMAGMAQHIDFVTQPTVQADEQKLRPDVVVRLPGGKTLVVDAKTPLEAYLGALDAPDEAARATRLRDHARQVENHVKALGSKEYWRTLPVNPDFVVMFIPGDVFYAAALEHDPTLFEKAIRCKVIPATPHTLLALLNTVAYCWQQEKIADNAQAIADLGRQLYDRFRTFAEYMKHLGTSLRHSVDRYNQAISSLESRFLPMARKFETLGPVAMGVALPNLEQIDLQPRALSAPELNGGAAAEKIPEIA
jgi:DNA recombination protein RmuC